MVYKPPARLQHSVSGPCKNETILKPKRPISVGARIEQNSWTPTIRKGRIAAELLDGKPSYKAVPPLLGPHIVDSKKRAAPAYSMGRKYQPHSSRLEDGPAKFNVSGVYKTGLHRPPAFSIKSRTTEIKKWSGPGANRYEISGAVAATTRTIPSFSFGKRPVKIKTLPTPGPNVYNLPPIFGTSKEAQIKAAPAYSLVGRDKPRQIPAFITPGPGQYEDNTNYFKKMPPKYSLHVKHKIISDEHMKPGPATHCPEKYIRNKSVPAPSFSIHHTPYLGQRKAYLIRDCTPASSKRDQWVL